MVQLHTKRWAGFFFRVVGFQRPKTNHSLACMRWSKRLYGHNHKQASPAQKQSFIVTLVTHPRHLGHGPWRRPESRDGAFAYRRMRSLPYFESDPKYLLTFRFWRKLTTSPRLPRGLRIFVYRAEPQEGVGCQRKKWCRVIGEHRGLPQVCENDDQVCSWG